MHRRLVLVSLLKTLGHDLSVRNEITVEELKHMLEARIGLPANLQKLKDAAKDFSRTRHARLLQLARRRRHRAEARRQEKGKKFGAEVFFVGTAR
jgi:hypothetical protein